jgi:hypothetical protein
LLKNDTFVQDVRVCSRRTRLFKKNLFPPQRTDLVHRITYIISSHHHIPLQNFRTRGATTKKEVDDEAVCRHIGVICFLATPAVADPNKAAQLRKRPKYMGCQGTTRLTAATLQIPMASEPTAVMVSTTSRVERRVSQAIIRQPAMTEPNLPKICMAGWQEQSPDMQNIKTGMFKRNMNTS